MNKKMIIFGVILLVFFIIIAFLIISLTKPKGNTDNNGDDEDTTNTNNANKTRLVYYNLWEPSSTIQPLIDEYEALNNSIEIEYVNKSITQYELNTYTRLVQGSTTNEPVPDIIKINATWLPKFQPYLASIPASVMSSSDYKSAFYPVAQDAFTGLNGQIYAIPQSIDGLVLFYNKSLLAQAGVATPPADWNSFLELAIKLTKTDQNGTITQAGVGMGTSSNVKHSADILNLLFFQNGAQILSSDGKSVSLEGTKASNALKYYTDYSKVYNVWSADLGYDLDEFYAGKVAMFFGPSWRAFDIINASAQLDFGITSVPQLPNNPRADYAMFWGDAVPNKSQNQLEAWKFIKWLSEKEQMRKQYENGAKIRSFGQPYSRPDIAEELTSHPYVKPVMESAPTMKIWQMGDQAYVESELNKAISSVTNGSKAPSVALDEAKTNINSKYSTYFD